MGKIKDTVTKDIQAQKADGIVEKSQYDQALAQYDLNITDEEVKAAVTKIIAEKVSENDNLDVKKFLLGSVELTTLSTTDTEEKVLAMIEKVNRFDSEYPDLPHVAAVCAYPCFRQPRGRRCRNHQRNRQLPLFADLLGGKDHRDGTGHQGRSDQHRHRHACRQIPVRRL